MNVLVISPESWSHIFVSKHHFAMELTRQGHQVVFLNPPSDRSGLVLTPAPENPAILVVDYAVPFRGQRFLPAALSRFVDARICAKIEKLVNLRFDVVWNFENSRFFDLRFAGDRLKIYHQVDLNQQFHIKDAASTADICFCTSDIIREVILPWNQNVFKIHHGTSEDALRFQYTRKKTAGDPVTAMYVGNLEMQYLDLELLEQLIRRFNDVMFVFVGPFQPGGDAHMMLSKYPNVRIEGKRPAAEIPGYLDQADILLVIYKEAYHRDQSSPHKFMEYLASGRTIVATYTDEYKDKRNLVAMCDHNKEYLALFDDIRRNIATYNDPLIEQQRIAFAASNTYEKQLKNIISRCIEIRPGSFS